VFNLHFHNIKTREQSNTSTYRDWFRVSF